MSDDTTNNAKTVEQGIVVEDENGNQYVWIFCTTNETKTILEYKRNEWDVAENGNTRASKDEVTLTDAICSNDDIVNGLTTEIKNEIVEQIKKEKNSVNNYGGYYIGRYEVGNENNVAVIKKDQEPYTNYNGIKLMSLLKELVEELELQHIYAQVMLGTQQLILYKTQEQKIMQQPEKDLMKIGMQKK